MWNFNLFVVGNKFFFFLFDKEGIKCDYFCLELKLVFKK